eukprot:CAMPEP_0119326444 /NCGR_PEP_ID=MMETSP1333-20130426/68417_1 /TAXON_ID=418940 /ORGANISM="Scyphosphaera apsteinii, Strain RCC1455" /LENGTH=245 /DNA_ID=CAMNT_0007334755 /DNA_START=336 /DNA_END=1070 /DNA_ORIENTATION=+
MDSALAFHSTGACRRIAVWAYAHLAGLASDPASNSVRARPGGDPLLAYCAAFQCRRAISLMERGLSLDVNELAPGQAFGTALHSAARRGDEALLKALLAAGAQPDAITQDLVKEDSTGTAGGRTALHEAAMAGAVNAALLLAEAHPQCLAMSDWDGHTAAQVAWYMGEQELALQLRSLERAQADVHLSYLRSIEEPCSQEEREQEDGARCVRLADRKRAALCIEHRTALHEVYQLREAWSGEQCE